MRNVVSTDTVSATSFTSSGVSDCEVGEWSEIQVEVKVSEIHLKHVSQVDREIHPKHNNITIIHM